MNRPVAALFLLLFAAMARPAVSAPSAIFAFGDSLSDVGNDLKAFKIPVSPPYYDGRFSNGPNWVEDLASHYGLAPMLPSLSGGTDYAYGGARSGLRGTLIPGIPGTEVIPSTREQVATFLDLHPTGVPRTALYTVWSGANDIIAAGFDYSSSGGTNALQLSAGIDQAAAFEATAINDLVKAGARDIVVVGLPDIGITPLFATDFYHTFLPTTNTFVTAISQQYNLTLSQAVARIPGVQYFDVLPLFANAVADPASYGFANATTGCYAGVDFGKTPAPVCSDDLAVQNSYLFWDMVHPTQAGHALIAELVVPEPASATVLALGLGGLLAARRRVGQPG